MTGNSLRQAHRDRRAARARRHKLAVGVVGLLVGSAMATGAADAYWRGSGAGTGTAAVGTLQPAVLQALVAADQPSDRLRPGGPAAEVVLRVDNPNAFAVEVVSVVQSGAITAVGGTGTCTTTGVTFTAPSPASIVPGSTLAPGVSVLRLPGAASMGVSAEAGCQGATFRIPVTLAVHR